MLAELPQLSCEPEWLRTMRNEAFGDYLSSEKFLSWAPEELRNLPLEDLCENAYHTSDSLSEDSAKLLDELGVEQEQAEYLTGAHAQIDRNIVYRNLQEPLKKLGVIFADSLQGLTEYADIFRPYFGSVIRRDENLFTKLNASMFSGGSFIYIPPGVKLATPLKCFMHLQKPGASQFGRTLIIVGKNAEVTFFESCTSASNPMVSLHCSVGEFVLGEGSRLNYVALQNWKPNVFNLSILRARLAAHASINWIDCTIGGRFTMKYPCALLEGDGASAEATSISVANTGQYHDTGAKMLHLASNTSSKIVSKSVSMGTGCANYRGLVEIPKTVRGCKNHTQCDAMLLDSNSRSKTYPAIRVNGIGNSTEHEASVSRLSENQLFYMRSRGVPEAAARSMIVNGFVNDLVQNFPIQYSVQIRRLIELEMSGSVG